MLPYVGIKLQEQIGDVLAGIHSQLRFVLAVSLDEPSRRAALDGQPALAFKLPYVDGWVLIDQQSLAVSRANDKGNSERSYTALSQSEAVMQTVRKSAAWGKGDKLSERAIQGILTNDRAAFQNLLAVAPLIETQAYSLAARLTQVLDALRADVRRAIAEDGRSGTLAKHYWLFAGILARATLLATTPGASPWLTDTAHSFTWDTWTPSFPLVRERNCWMAAIGARAAAEFGPDVLPEYAETLKRARHPLTAADAIMGMTAIALRHESARERVLDDLRTLRYAPMQAEQVAPELFPLLFQQAEELLLNDRERSGARKYVLPTYRVDPSSYDPIRGYALFSQLPAALAAPVTSLIPGSGTSSVLPGHASADAMFARSWGPEPEFDQPAQRLH